LVELLAPAGSRESLAAAVESGADAVYLAGNMFGARAYASNFDEEGLREAIHFAHLRGVHVHVTVNTIVDDTELPRLADYLRFLYEAGADALLIQDLGVARLARAIVPDMPLHASTQMTVHNLEGVLALQALGFSRVVLSRELSLKDIRYICSNSDVEIETFMHGALCVCYSGQCLMSSMIGGRSGNRGRCAQPCRLPYALVDAEGKDLLGDRAGQYLLSPKDFNTIDVLPELIEAGVASLKIEGRMKRPEYVATVVRTYREALDRCLSGEGYYVTAKERNDLTQIFNRDFTTAYLKSRPGRHMMSDRRPNNRGLLIGRVAAYDREKRLVTVKLSGNLALGDEVDFWVKVGGRVTASVKKLLNKQGQEIFQGSVDDEVIFSVPSAVRVHDRVFKVYDAALMEAAKRVYAAGAPVRRIPVSVRAAAAVGRPLFIHMEDADGNTADAETEFIGEEAKKRPLSEEVIRKQIDRMGSSIFSLKELSVDIRGNVMVPMSEINDARRRAVLELERQRLAAFDRAPLPKGVDIPSLGKDDMGKQVGKSLLIVSVDTLEKVKKALEAGADGILFGGESYAHEFLSAKHYRDAWELVRGAGRQIFFQTPRIVLQCHAKGLEQLLESFGEFLPDEIYVHNIGTLALVERLTEIPVHADYSLISYNHLTLDFFKERGVAGATLSPELTWQQVEDLAKKSSLPLECIVHGNLELMVSEYCVTGSFLGDVGNQPCSQPCKAGKYFLRDRKGVLFPLAMDQFCHMHVLNGKTLSMLSYANKFRDMGIQRIRLEGKLESAEGLARLVSAYRRAMEYSEEQMEAQEGKLHEIEGDNITRGHYFRGVM